MANIMNSKISYQTNLWLCFVILAACIPNPSSGSDQHGCQKVFFGPPEQQNMACSCNCTHCDRGLERFDWPLNSKEIIRVQSNKNGLRFALDRVDLSDLKLSEIADYELQVNLSDIRQRVIGFGGAFTDTSIALINGMDAHLRSSLIAEYYSDHGLEYSLARVPIAGCDMSAEPYTYDDLLDVVCSPKARGSAAESSACSDTGDFELRQYRLQREDFDLKIPFIHEINSIKAKRGLEPLKLITTSWSAPTWMKENNNIARGFLGSACDRGNTKANYRYYRAYARYIIRFLEEYSKHGISFWALAPQNQPFSAHSMPMNSVQFTPQQLAYFMAEHILPELNNLSSAISHPLLFAYEDNAKYFPPYLKEIMQYENLRSQLAGFSLHWYDQSKGVIDYKELEDIVRLIEPEFLKLSTEATFFPDRSPGNWSRGEAYVKDMISTLNLGFIGWMDWNLLLDAEGGPNWPGRKIDSPIFMDQLQYFKNPTFYAMGHLSRFFQSNSRVVGSRLFPLNGSNQTLVLAAAGIMDQESQDSPRKLAIVILNEAPEATCINIRIDGCRKQVNPREIRDQFQLNISANSFTSLALTCE